MNIGDKIKSARLAKGYTQEELGNMLGVQKSAIAKYEKGRVVNIKRSVLAKISKVLDIPPVELVSDIEERPVDTANILMDIAFDKELMDMIEAYKKLPAPKQAQVKEYVYLLSGKD